MTDSIPNENDNNDVACAADSPCFTDSVQETHQLAATKQAKKPGMVGYWIVLVLLVFAAVDGSCVIGKIFELMGREFHIVAVGDKTAIELAEPGEYTIYNMIECTSDGKVHRGPSSLPPMSCKLSSERGPIKVRAMDEKVSFSSETMSCESIWSFEIDRAGTYVFESSFTSPTDESKVLLGISPTFSMGDIGVIVLLGIAIVPLILGAIIVGVITFARRSAASKA